MNNVKEESTEEITKNDAVGEYYGAQVEIFRVADEYRAKIGKVMNETQPKGKEYPAYCIKEINEGIRSGDIDRGKIDYLLNRVNTAIEMSQNFLDDPDIQEKIRRLKELKKQFVIDKATAYNKHYSRVDFNIMQGKVEIFYTKDGKLFALPIEVGVCENAEKLIAKIKAFQETSGYKSELAESPQIKAAVDEYIGFIKENQEVKLPAGYNSPVTKPIQQQE